MVGIIDSKTLNFLNNIAIAISKKNIDRIIHLLIDIGILKSELINIISVFEKIERKIKE